jgi:hypothetical protein
MTDLRKIDALVAEHVMGKTIRDGLVDKSEELNSKGCWREPDLYSSDISAAWEVVEAWKGDGAEYSLPEFSLRRDGRGSWEVLMFDAGPGRDLARTVPVRAETAPLAICLAALKAKGIEV